MTVNDPYNKSDTLESYRKKIQAKSTIPAKYKTQAEQDLYLSKTPKQGRNYMKKFEHTQLEFSNNQKKNRLQSRIRGGDFLNQAQTIHKTEPEEKAFFKNRAKRVQKEGHWQIVSEN